VSTIVNILPYAQIGLAVLLSTGIILQHSDASLGGAFGGADNWSSTFHTRRGFEKILFYGTIVVAILFAITSLAAVSI